ncbi:hypothetical protein [Sphingomonas crocodyli]|uniref:Cupin domain-containing protein n=1 Tax=Sphingomonas crocodyli TaxID=1979270 RepID=A0A437M7Q9_9SPHN|nr:hypothetical protein [Sphingomonas crocodyli]RVT93627.1 hypothetical protein EOD43_07100 [Sphingomonas crocodyli]
MADQEDRYPLPDINKKVRITTLDDHRWQIVRRQKIGDRTVEAREKWMEFNPRYLSAYVEWDPGMMIRAHGHNSDHIVFVMAGSMMCGDRECLPGTHLALDHGDTFGPFIAGPDGCTTYMIMMGDPGSFPADPAGFEKLRQERGVVQLPDMDIEMPAFMKDPRNAVTKDGS